MRFVSYASSSAANSCEVIAESGGRLLLEAGLPWAKMREKFGFNLSGVEAIFCTHFHLDHCRALPDVIRFGVETYANQETFDKVVPGPLAHNAHILADGVSINTGSFIVMPFPGVHTDFNGVKVPVFGFIVKEIATGQYLLFATDTARITQEFFHLEEDAYTGEKQRCRIPFSIVAVACNFDTDRLDDMVEKENIHEALAIRLLGSHPSKQGLQAYLRGHCDLSRCRYIHLLHLSGSTIDQEATRKEFEDMFLITTNIVSSPSCGIVD